MSRILLDAGALIALDRSERTMWGRLTVAARDSTPLLTHGGIVGQVWRSARKQAQVGKALNAINVLPIDADLGRAAGLLLAKSGTADVLDAALACLCESGDVLYTSDLDDLTMLIEARGIRNVAVVRVR